MVSIKVWVNAVLIPLLKKWEQRNSNNWHNWWAKNKVKRCKPQGPEGHLGGRGEWYEEATHVRQPGKLLIATALA